MKTCSVDNCGRKHHGKGFCGKYYIRHYHKKDVSTPDRMLPVKEKILKCKSENGCWEWKWYISPYGYGNVYHENKLQLAHRLSYKFFKGEIPNEMLVCHSCDNRACVNPDHLFLGTNADNQADKVNKGRQNKGSNTKFAKLNEDDIPNIRKRLETGESQRSIANYYNVTQSTINCIARGNTWKHA